MVRQFIPNS